MAGPFWPGPPGKAPWLGGNQWRGGATPTLSVLWSQDAAGLPQWLPENRPRPPFTWPSPGLRLDAQETLMGGRWRPPHRPQAPGPGAALWGEQPAPAGDTPQVVLQPAAPAFVLTCDLALRPQGPSSPLSTRWQSGSCCPKPCAALHGHPWAGGPGLWASGRTGRLRCRHSWGRSLPASTAAPAQGHAAPRRFPWGPRELPTTTHRLHPLLWGCGLCGAQSGPKSPGASPLQERRVEYPREC